MRVILHDLFHWHKWTCAGQVDGHIPFTYVHDVRVCSLCNTCEVGMLHWRHGGWFTGDYTPIDPSEIDKYLSEIRVKEQQRRQKRREYEKTSIEHALKVIRRYICE